MGARMSIESASQGETDSEDYGLLNCRVPGCTETEISNYGGHFSRSHREVPLELISVTTDGGKVLTAHDLFNYAIKCNLCPYVSVTGHATIAFARKSMRKHWQRDHSTLPLEEMSFSDIMPKDHKEGINDDSFPVEMLNTKEKTQIASTSYRCGQCEKLLMPCGNLSLIKHWTSQHPNVPLLALTVTRDSDNMEVNLKELYNFVFKCDAPDCSHIAVSHQSQGHVITKMKEHWMRCHNRMCEPRYSSVEHLGYLCQVSQCNTVFTSPEDLPKHHSVHRDLRLRDMYVKDLETKRILGLRDIFDWVKECPADFEAQFFSNVDEDSVVKAGHDQWEMYHADMSKVGSENLRAGFQCMAGADDGEVGCSTVIPEGNNGNALRHWRYKHSGLPLRDLVFMNQSSGAFLQISDVFSRVLVCTYKRCGLVTYTNYLNRGGRVMAAHWEREHGLKEEFDQIYDNMDTLTFLAGNHNINHEEFVDFEHEEDFPSSLDDNLDDDVIENTSGLDDPEVSPGEMQITGYRCGIIDCHKTVAVSKVSTSMVALNRLKNHFSKMHKELPSEDFKYEIQYHQDFDNSDSIVAVENPSTSLHEKTELIEYPSTIYQCPAIVEAGRQCPEKMMDANALRIHWGSRHNVDGQAFIPIQINIHDTSHYVCCVKGCNFRQLTRGPMRSHYDKEHQDQPNRFEVVFIEHKMPSSSVNTKCDSESILQERMVTESIDEAPMIPVGRKTKVPPLPENGSFQCRVSQCLYQTECQRDLEAHSRVCGESWFMCLIRGCGLKMLGKAGVTEHMEVVHRIVQVKDWDYKEIVERKRARSKSSDDLNFAGPSHSAEKSLKRAKVECAVSANFDFTGLDGSTTGESDSDFDVDYTVV